MTPSALSPNEQWLWLVEQLTPGSIARTTATLGRRIEGPLDVDRLRQCVTELIRRHETLRTTYVVRDGNLVRVVSDDASPDWIWRDLSDEPEDERLGIGLRQMDEERTRHIDISSGRQTRCWVARISQREHLMLFATHHIAADAASLVLLEEELSSLYSNGVTADNTLVPESRPYTQFVQWQAGGQVAGQEEAQRYWATMAAGAEPVNLDAVMGPPVSDRITGYTMTVSPQGFEDRQQVALGLPLSAKVHELVRTSRCSLFMVLLAALQLLLHLRTGQRSFLIRTPSSNRMRPEHRTMIGALETHIFVRCEAEPDLRFIDMLQGVRTQVMTGLKQHGVPMSLVLGSALNRGQAASRSVGLAGGMVQFALFALGRMSSWDESLDVSVCAGSRIGTPADLQVFAMEEGRRLDGAAPVFATEGGRRDGPAPGIVLEANNPGGAYTRESVQEFLGALRDVLAAVVVDPEVTIAQLGAEFPPRLDPAAAPATSGLSTPDTPPGGGRDAPGTATRHDAIERLLGIARSAIADQTVTPEQSLFRSPERAIDTGVRLLDALNAAEPAGAELNVTLTDLLERPTVAGLVALAGGRPVAH